MDLSIVHLHWDVSMDCRSESESGIGGLQPPCPVSQLRRRWLLYKGIDIVPARDKYNVQNNAGQTGPGIGRGPSAGVEMDRDQMANR